VLHTNQTYLAAGAYAACTGFLLLLSVCGLALDEKFLDTVRPDKSGVIVTRGNILSYNHYQQNWLQCEFTQNCLGAEEKEGLKSLNMQAICQPQ
jgi:hypothetical protein